MYRTIRQLAPPWPPALEHPTFKYFYARAVKNKVGRLKIGNALRFPLTDNHSFSADIIAPGHKNCNLAVGFDRSIDLGQKVDMLVHSR